jgi:hypothetical protein
VACADSQQAHSGGAAASGQPAQGQSCQDFAEKSNRLPSNAILSSVTCTAGTTPSNASRVVTYNSSYPNLVVKAGDACPASILADVKSSYGSSASCAITSVSQPTKTYQGTCADNAAAIASLCSAAANHGCSTPVDNQSSANQPYQTSVSHKPVQGTITCNTKCTDAYGACGSVTTGTVGDVYHACVATAGPTLKSSGQTGVLASKKDSLCADPDKVVVDRSYHTTGTMPQYVAGSASAASDPNALINYIKTRSAELLGSELPATSVFVRQTDGGTGGTEGKAYKAFAASVGGENHDVNAPASEYASSLQSLGGVIKEKLARSFSIQGFMPDQKVQRVWYQAQGTSAWIEKTEGTDWSASGGTVTVSPSFDMRAGDNFRVEYK